MLITYLWWSLEFDRPCVIVLLIVVIDFLQTIENRVHRVGLSVILLLSFVCFST